MRNSLTLTAGASSTLPLSGQFLIVRSVTNEFEISSVGQDLPPFLVEAGDVVQFVGNTTEIKITNRSSITNNLVFDNPPVLVTKSTGQHVHVVGSVAVSTVNTVNQIKQPGGMNCQALITVPKNTEAWLIGENDNRHVVIIQSTSGTYTKCHIGQSMEAISDSKGIVIESGQGITGHAVLETTSELYIRNTGASSGVAKIQVTELFYT